MCAALSRITAVFLLVVLMLISPGLPAAAQNADAELMARVMVQRENELPLAGPLTGTMVQSAENVSYSGSGVQVGDFTAHVAFTNPSDGAPWDIGFDFGGATQISQQIVVDSSAQWVFASYPEGELQSGSAPGLSPQPGARNSLDLLVQGNLGVLYVSGMYVGSFQIPGPVSGEVSVITGSYTSMTVDGRAMPFTDFTVWALPNTSGLPQAETIASTTDQAPIQQQQPVQQPASADQGQAIPGAVPGQDELTYQDVFAAMSMKSTAMPPLAGPVNDTLIENPAGLAGFGAGVMVENFHALADFTVPAADVSNVPWDIGFIFGDQSVAGVRVTVNSLGMWRTSVGSDVPAARGPVANLATQPGDSNTLSLFVLNGYAVLGVNGQYAADFPLPIMPGTGDVGVGVGFFADELSPGRVTTFQNFAVRPVESPTGAPPASLPQGADQATAQGATQGQPVVQAPAQGSTQTQPAQAPVQAPAQASLQDVDIYSPEFQQQFTSLLTQLEAAPPREGPSSFQLVESGNGTPTRMAGQMTPNASDFISVITFINPTETLPPWTAGLAFRSQEQVLLTSTGHVLAIHETGGEPRVIGEAMNFDPTPGARNTLQVFAIADEVLVGVNGVPVAKGPLPDQSSGMGVALIAGVIPQDQVANRVIAYEDYRLWYGGEIASGGGQG